VNSEATRDIPVVAAPLHVPPTVNSTYGFDGLAQDTSKKRSDHQISATPVLTPVVTTPVLATPVLAPPRRKRMSGSDGSIDQTISEM